MTTTGIVLARSGSGFGIDVELPDGVYADRPWIDPAALMKSARSRLRPAQLGPEYEQVGFVEFPEGDLVLYPEYTGEGGGPGITGGL